MSFDATTVADVAVNNENEILTSLAPENLPAIFGNLMDGYRQREYGRGYDRARLDLLAALVPLAERYLRSRNWQSSEARQLIYGFIDLLEQEIEGASKENGLVTGGLGI